MSACRWVPALLLVLGAMPARAAAQRLESRFQTGGRVDVLASQVTALQAALELSAAAGTNVRLAFVAGAGPSWERGRTGLSARADLVGRFLLDPDFRSRWSPYVGGGLGLRYDRLTNWRGTLIAVLGMEGPNWGGAVPFVEAGVGGGVRIGFGLRVARRAGR